MGAAFVLGRNLCLPGHHAHHYVELLEQEPVSTLVIMRCSGAGQGCV
jgi:hypothetical protein